MAIRPTEIYALRFQRISELREEPLARRKASDEKNRLHGARLQSPTKKYFNNAPKWAYELAGAA